MSEERVLPWELNNCTAIFSLSNVREPVSNVYCKKQDPGADYYVTGITLRSGLPPGKPLNISCETTRNAGFIECKWKKGRETYEPTTYNISVNIGNGSWEYSHTVQDEGNCTIPQNIFHDNFTYHLMVSAHNHFGKSHSDPLTFTFNDIVVPEMPHITQIDFNESLVAVLHWKTHESFESLKPYIRVHTAGHWEKREVSEIGDGLVHVAGLRPLTDYSFQVRTCTKRQQTDTNLHTARKMVCSKWSPSVWKKTPGKGPSEPLHVWRDSTLQQVAIVFWKPPPSHEYSGEVSQYEIDFGDGQKQEHRCAPMSECSARVPLLPPISVTAVTPYGTSPPATVPLTQSDAPGPVLREVTPSVNSRTVTVSWTRPEQNEEVMNYVTECTTLPPTALHWKAVSKDHKYTTITGLMPGVLYNISVYAVTTSGVSAPSSSAVYSKELKPLFGPSMSVLVHEANKVLVKWDELPVEQRRGFITYYTIYYHVLSSTRSQLKASVPASGPRQRWLDCPEGTLALQMSASTAAGEGPRGNLITSHPPAPSAGLVIVIVFIIMFFVAIIVNLMCWKCVRKRIKQKCIAWSPECLGDNLPKPINSNAIKLLGLDRSEPSLFSSFSDPPLSPISFLQDEREELYPFVHVEMGPSQTESTLLRPEFTNDIYNPSINLEYDNYKPQTTAFPVLEKNKEVEDSEGQNTSSHQFEEFSEGLLSNVQVELNDSQTEFNLIPSWSKTDDMNAVTMEKRADKMDSKPDLLLVKLSEESSNIALVDFFDNVDGVLASGYFPQITSPID
ncbi:interleukin-23 receptor [Periophthalmus magnuspinnatus]|uniref:interleukin-23 receptor n=1 Tax=Periophthalmus magnuspinnatus TaxID=409849 RepID=UPI002436F011|nr:interleukin-23 receptor [Periophthalmus magnuspinnatus]